MGLLTRREEVRNDPGWLTRGDDDDAWDSSSSAGVRVTSRVALSLTTIWRCVDLLQSAISQAPKVVQLKVGGQTFEQFGKPAWLMNPDPSNPAYTINDYFSQIAISLLIDGNYFVRVVPDVYDPIGLLIIPAARVRVRAGPVYDILNATGQLVETVGPERMLHGCWLQLPGELRGVSPLENLRRSIGGAVAAEEFAGRFYSQGTTLSFGVEVPYAMPQGKKDEFREDMRKNLAGLKKAHGIGILTDNAKFVTGLQPTPEQAQMLGTRKWSKEDLCTPFGVPPAMAGSQEPGAASFASTDTYDRWFKERGCLPLARRIETQHDRLLQVPSGVSDPNASMQFRFNLDGVARVNLLERYQAHAAGVQGGFLTPNEARAYEDEPPLAGGDRLYMQQQMVPIDLLGATKATEPLDTQPAPAEAQAA